MESLKTEKKQNLISKAIMEDLKKLPTNITYDTQELIFLAGFIDAECCITIQRDVPKNKPNPVFKILLRLNDTKSPMFYWLKQRFGGCITWMNKGKAYKPQLIWIIRGRECYFLLQKIIPYLKYKRPVAEKVTEFFETTLKNGGARHTEEFRLQYAKVLSIREGIVSQVRFLNHKGS